MGEEDKKPEEVKKPEEKTDDPPSADKPAAGGDGGGDKKPEGEDSKDLPPPPPPPQEIVLRVYMHCEGCARKVRRCLKGFDGVEEVVTDCKTHTVVVKGEKADPLKVLERVQKKSHRQVELISPIPPPPPPAEEPKKPPEEAAQPEEKKEEPQVITVVLKVHMHCEACAQEIKRRIQRMKGVEIAEPDFKGSSVTVKGVFDPPALVEYVAKRTGKKAVILKVEPETKEAAEETPKAAGGESEEKKGEEVAKETKEVSGAEEAPAAAATVEVQEEQKLEVRKNELYYYYYYPPPNYYHHPNPPPPRFAHEMYGGEGDQPPQMFSDENPNACSVM